METKQEIPIDTGKGLMLEPITLDGWYNQLSGLAIYGADKRENTNAVFTRKTYEFLSAVYQSSWLAARIVDKPIDEMLREGFNVVVGEDTDVAHDTEEALTDINWELAFRRALTWQSLYGGSCILMGINDGIADLSQPVDTKAIKGIDYLNVFDASECRVVAWQQNPALPNFGEPIYFCIIPTLTGNEVPVPASALVKPKTEKPGDKTEAGEPKPKLQATTDADPALPAGTPGSQGDQSVVSSLLIPGMQKIHATRILYFPGEQISRRANLWQSTPGAQTRHGDSSLLRIIKLIRDFEGAWDGTAYNLQEFEQAIFKIQGLAAALASDKQGFVQKRWHSIQLSRSMIHAVMLDKDGEDYDRKASSMSGVADTLREFAVILAAAADMPVSVLLGSQSGGLGASGSGQNDIQNWYAAVKTQQNKRLLPQLKCLLTYLFIAKEGPTTGTEPDHWRVQFNPLTQLSEKEMGELYYKVSQADQIYFNMGAISNTDIAKSRFSGRPFTVAMTVDMKELDAREKMLTTVNAETAKATVKNLKTGGSPDPLPPAPVKPPAKK